MNESFSFPITSLTYGSFLRVSSYSIIHVKGLPRSTEQVDPLDGGHQFRDSFEVKTPFWGGLCPEGHPTEFFPWEPNPPTDVWCFVYAAIFELLLATDWEIEQFRVF